MPSMQADAAHGDPRRANAGSFCERLLECVLALAIVAATACGPDGGSSMRQLSRPANHEINTAASDTDWFVEGPAAPSRRTPEIERLLRQLDLVRAACEFYRAKNRNRYPDFGQEGWTPLIESRLLRETPRNPLSPTAVASKILVIRRTGITGANIDPAKAGWVWLDRGHMGGVMFAAGVRD